jgi:hypothetical protein
MHMVVFVMGLDLMTDVPRTLDSDAILATLMNSHSELTGDGDIIKQYSTFYSVKHASSS